MHETATVTVPLKHGYRLGETALRQAVLRELTTGDILDARAASERLVMVPGEGPALVCSPSGMGVETLRRQIVRLEDGGEPLQGPLSVAQMGRLHPDDFAAIQDAADRMDAASLQAAERAAARGRADGGGGGA
jgi:phage FluMu protein gp41